MELLTKNIAPRTLGGLTSRTYIPLFQRSESSNRHEAVTFSEGIENFPVPGKGNLPEKLLIISG